MAICKLFNCFLRNAHVIQKILSVTCLKLLIGQWGIHVRDKNADNKWLKNKVSRFLWAFIYRLKIIIFEIIDIQNIRFKFFSNLNRVYSSFKVN